jgi:hypothetical protein
MSSCAPEANLFLRFTSRFDQLKVPYMVTGSVAAMIYGEIRVTHDVDLIAVLNFSAATTLPKLFPAPEFYCPPTDVITLEIARDLRGHFNIIHVDSGFKADVYLSGRDPLHAWALNRIRRVNVGGAELNLAPPEYVIVRKLEYFREGASEKHLRDIKTMLDHSGKEISNLELDRLISERGLTAEWQRVQSTAM